jgi:hypothetical protein
LAQASEKHLFFTPQSQGSWASVVKLVDTADLKSAADERRRTGSIPVRGTKQKKTDASE